jgi:dTDP-4-dehydrorhamnose reductase
MTSPRGTVLLTGATGLLGGHLAPVLAAGGWTRVVALGGPTRGEGRGVDLADTEAVDALVRTLRPQVVIHSAALAAAADCLADPARARRINVDAPANLARGLRAHGGRLVHVSTDLVFDGEHAPYDERASAAPVSVYGKTKADAEAAVLAAGGDAVVVRTSLLFGPTRTARQGFFDAQLRAIASGQPIVLFEDEWRTPLALGAAASALAAIAASEVDGILHLGGPERMSRYEMGIRLARLLGVSGERAGQITAGKRPEAGAGEPRPRDVSLDSSQFRSLFPGLATAGFEEACARMGVGP